MQGLCRHCRLPLTSQRPCPGKVAGLDSTTIAELMSPPRPVTLDDVTTEKTKVEHLSYSQLSMYLRCGMQYYFRYILGIKTPPELAPSAGTAGHDAVEADSKRKIRTGASMPLDELLDYFSGVYDMRVRDVEEKPDEDKGRTKDEIVNGLSVYTETVAPKVLPIIVEHKFTLDMPGKHRPIRPIIGRIDLVTHRLGIWDNKFITTRRGKSQLEVDISPQLTTYDAAFEQQTGKPASEVGIIQFKPPGRDVLRYPAEVTMIKRKAMTPEQRQDRIARTAYQFETAEAGIAAGIFIPTDNPMTCGWCGYRDRCQSSQVTDYEAMQIRNATDE